MSIRGSVIAADPSAVSLTMSLPAGSAAGDLAIAFGSHGYPVDIPSGFTSIYQNNALTYNVMAAYRVLDSGDISTGTVTVQATGPYLPYAAVISAALVVFAGSGGGVREYQAGNGGGFSGTVTNTTTSAVLSTDTALYWASMASGSAYPTITPGSGSATTLQSITAGGGIYSVLADQAMPGGALAVANAFGNGSYVAVQVIVEIGIAPPGGLLADPGMGGGMQQLTGGMDG